MAKIILKRKSEWNNRARKYRIYIDGEKKDAITNGEIKEIELEPGKHKIIAKIDWCSSPELDIELTEERAKTIEVSNFKASKWVLILFYIIFGIYLIDKLVLKAGLEKIMFLSIPLLLVLLYYLSLGRKKYLEIGEI